MLSANRKITIELSLSDCLIIEESLRWQKELSQRCMKVSAAEGYCHILVDLYHQKHAEQRRCLEVFSNQLTKQRHEFTINPPDTTNREAPIADHASGTNIC